jgi:hypothetical protein
MQKIAASAAEQIFLLLNANVTLLVAPFQTTPFQTVLQINSPG